MARPATRLTSIRTARIETSSGLAPSLSGRWSEDRVAGTAAKAYARIAAAWRLRNEEAAGLIDVSPRTWARMKAGIWSGRLSKDQLLRISGVTGLYKALHLYFSDPLADEWVGLANEGQSFGGQAPKAVMIGSGLPAILQTRDYVDALRGGV